MLLNKQSYQEYRYILSVCILHEVWTEPTVSPVIYIWIIFHHLIREAKERIVESKPNNSNE